MRCERELLRWCTTSVEGAVVDAVVAAMGSDMVVVVGCNVRRSHQAVWIRSKKRAIASPSHGGHMPMPNAVVTHT